MAGYDTITYGGVELYVTNMVVKQVPATKKQKVGRELVKIKVIGLNTLDYELEISGIITGTSTATLISNRAAIDALNDCNYHALTTGIAGQAGNYIIEPNSLVWSDNSNDGQMLYRYNMKLIQYTQ